jgi:radical SAM superfamily enzyme YgiQ (UPF0313 family)
MPSIAFIQPRFSNREVDRNIKTVYPLGLGYLASHVPPHWTPRIVDEQIEQIDLDMDVDAVGITTTTLTCNRAYELAAAFKKRGVPVLLGGVHASMCAEEAAPFCDALCIGDGEQVIGEMLRDLDDGCLKPEYRGELGALDGLKLPRHDLFKPGYSFLPVNTSRGCPFSCNFCAINKFYGGEYRKRSVEDVMVELRRLPSGYSTVFFSDGNMYGYSPRDVTRFKEMCRRMAEERKAGNLPFERFACYASVNALDDLEALDLASAAGCFALFVGFESINPAALEQMNKTMNLRYGVDSYPQLVRNAQERKILVVGEMIVGNDADDPETLEETRLFLEKIDFDLLRLQILQPIPGTDLFDSLKEEGRLYWSNFPEDWRKGEKDFVLGVHFELKNLTDYELKRWVRDTGLDFYRKRRILGRMLRTLRFTRSPKMVATLAVLNRKSRKSYANADIGSPG